MFTEIDFKPSNQRLKEFATGLSTLCLIAIPVTLYLTKESWMIVAGIGLAGAAVFALLRLLYPKALSPLYWLWMSVAMILGALLGPVILTLVYYFVLTPLALISRATGKVWLNTRRQDASYWKSLDTESPNSSTKPY